MIKVFEKNKGLAAFTTILIAIGIFIISSTPSRPSNFPSNLDLATIYHFFAFFFLQLFLLITVTKKSSLNLLTPSIIISLLYSILDELHQYFVPGRHCSFGDILTDFTGILLATTIYSLYKKHQKPNFK